MRLRMAVAVLSLLGILIATYLYLYKIGLVGTLACGAGGACETVQLSRWSEFLGVDVALIGVGGYAVLLGVALAGLQPGARDRRWPATALLGLSGVALAFTVYLKALELFVIHAICRWCVVSAVFVAAIFLLALADWRRTPATRADG